LPFELLVQFLVLGATAVLFWVARRDLASRMSPPAPVLQSTEDLEQLCGTLETLVTDLSQRLTALEQAARVTVLPVSAALPSVPRASAATVAPNAQYAPVYALLDEGVSEASEIARRTGLSRGEVDLILGLRARQVL
jgi:hypothetical protein